MLHKITFALKNQSQYIGIQGQGVKTSISPYFHIGDVTGYPRDNYNENT